MDKALYVRDMFATIAPRYDTTNRLLTAGADEVWRRRAIAELALPPGGTVLDLACGTGDIAVHMVRLDPSLHVVGGDFCEPMLAAARRRAGRRCIGRRLRARGGGRLVPHVPRPPPPGPAVTRR
jgi:demethylmenaquinone methyltransferase/2-methoxy-6-polyprenyl-1,4-benzoquinol methylase